MDSATGWMGRMVRTGLVAAGLAFASYVSHAQTTQTLNVWSAVAPGSERWTQTETTVENTPVGTVIINVVKPTLTAFLPKRTSAPGASVIIAPGGGIAAFVLKYRTVEKRGEGIPAIDQDVAAQYGIADGIQAIKVVRQRAAEWDAQKLT